MNKVLFLAAANISLPPMIPFIIFGSYKLGGIFYQNGTQLGSVKDLTMESIHVNFVQYFIGGTFLAVFSGLIGFGLSFILLKMFRK